MTSAICLLCVLQLLYIFQLLSPDCPFVRSLANAPPRPLRVLNAGSWEGVEEGHSSIMPLEVGPVSCEGARFQMSNARIIHRGDRMSNPAVIVSLRPCEGSGLNRSLEYSNFGCDPSKLIAAHSIKAQLGAPSIPFTGPDPFIPQLAS